MNLKQNKGIGAVDAIIAIGIFIIFTGIIVSISYNIYLQTNFIKRNEQATNYIVEIFEYAQGLIFEDDLTIENDVPLTQENLIKYINDIKKYENAKAVGGPYSEDEKQAAYTIFINVTEEKTNYIKKIDVTVMYKLGNKNKTVNMSTLINK